ncbi:hypothetical protein [Nocardia sp. NPDC047654]|uniref:hypothetical protein n=1 Tax=Nocardia sp. NPDC047654 TaxID=3364314 RepID=UPI003717E650
MPDTATAAVPYGCGPACGPWITVEQCGLFTFDQQTGEVLSVKCPSMNCFGQMVKVVLGRMADHDSPMDIALGGQKCPWIGIRVVFDSTRYPDLATRPASPPTQPPQAGR